MKKNSPLAISILIMVVMFPFVGFSQTTEFTYQGQLQNSSLPASGNYDFEFQLFDSLTSGSQVGSTLTRSGVAVANGIFSVKLDFGENFPGASRFLEIHVRQTGGGALTPLAPRQAITSTPHAIKALVADGATNATQLGGVAANQFVQTGDPRLSDARPPTAGSSNYVQNTTSQQSASNFNVSGDGTVGGTMRANVLRAGTTFNINAIPVLSIAGVGNTFVGSAAGTSNAGTFNSFFGNQSGSSNTSGTNNSFFGGLSGNANTTGTDNSFFGRNAGTANNADGNSFFGSFAGAANTTSTGNSFFGYQAGRNITNNGSNSLFGYQSGSNTTGARNSFFGFRSGLSNVTGTDNSFFGYQSGDSNINGIQNSFYGNLSGAENISGTSNSFFGQVAGGSNTSGPDNSFFGAFSGGQNTTGGSNSFFGFDAGVGNSSGNNNTAIGNGADVDAGNLSFATAIGAKSVVSGSNTIALGRPDGSDRVRVYGKLAINSLAAATSTNLCINTLTSEVAACSSSIRYKTNVATFNTGLSFVKRLRPVTFDWKDSNESDLGLIAEEVEAIEPLLVTHNQNGEVQGVKYDRIGVVLLNAVKQQQSQIEAQQKQIEILTQALCSLKPAMEICKQKEQ